MAPSKMCCVKINFLTDFGVSLIKRAISPVCYREERFGGIPFGVYYREERFVI